MPIAQACGPSDSDSALIRLKFPNRALVPLAFIFMAFQISTRETDIPTHFLVGDTLLVTRVEATGALQVRVKVRHHEATGEPVWSFNPYRLLPAERQHVAITAAPHLAGGAVPTPQGRREAGIPERERSPRRDIIGQLLTRPRPDA